MTDFETYTVETAPEAARPSMENTRKALGFVPNLIGTMAEAPTLAEAYLSVAGIFEKTSFDATERQVILLAVSRYNRCHYCMAAHSALASMQGAPQVVIDALRNDERIPDPRLEALRTFTAMMVEDRGWVDQESIDAFIEVGYNRQQVLEVIVGIGLKTLSNYANHVAGTPLDDVFKEQEWSE